MSDTLSFIAVSCGGSVQFIPFENPALLAAKAYEKARTIDRPETPKHVKDEA